MCMRNKRLGEAHIFQRVAAYLSPLHLSGQTRTHRAINRCVNQPLTKKYGHITWASTGGVRPYEFTPWSLFAN